MKKSIMAAPVLALAAAAVAYAQAGALSKVGIVQTQNAILSTKDGQKAYADLQARFTPKKEALEKKNSQIEQMRQQLRAGSATMSEDARNKLARDIETAQKNFTRDTEDAQAEVEHAENKIMQELGQQIMAVITKYARDNGYALVIDVSNPQTPVLYAGDGVDITQEVIELYDKASAPAPAPAPAAKPAAAPAPKPAAPPK